ncbi:hypothetical protein TB2_003423 [Malus domestica]
MASSDQSSSASFKSKAAPNSSSTLRLSATSIAKPLHHRRHYDKESRKDEDWYRQRRKLEGGKKKLI